jgi:hypothetical protein
MQLFGIPLSDAPPRVALKGGRVDLGRMQSRAVLYAPGTAAFTVSYTLVDGVGARLAGTASGFALWMFAGNGLGMAHCRRARKSALEPVSHSTAPSAETSRPSSPPASRG